jgi:ABC-type lipoprotein export system ATPase subunit
MIDKMALEKTKVGVEFNDLEASWKGITIFSDFSETLYFDGPNRMLPITGRSGSGKSTLMYILASLKAPTKGCVTWYFADGRVFSWAADKPLSQKEAHELRSDYFGFVFQDSTLLPYFTIFQNLSLQLENINVEESLIKNKIIDTLTLVTIESESVDEILDKFPHQLSGGQRQRMAIAQALVKQPVVLFADEPTGSLDSLTRSEIMQVIDNWVKQKGKNHAFIWVTHNESDHGPEHNRLSIQGEKRLCSLMFHQREN